MSRRRPSRKSSRRSRSHLLDQFSVHDIERWGELQDDILRFHWDYYHNLAYQRSQIAEELRKALIEAAEGLYEFTRWRRIVSYKYALEPLSVIGSLTDPGGRFNVGELDPTQFTPFPALYIAADRGTGLQERLSQNITPGKEVEALDFALLKPDSIVDVSVSGQLESVINLRHPARLDKFVGLIKGFTIPEHLTAMAKKIGHPVKLVRDRASLLESLMRPNWRGWPMVCDVPAPSQIFGQMVVRAGIEGILYPSRFSGKDCLVIFPQSFQGSDAFIQLDGPRPQGVQIERLDATTWKEVSQSPLSKYSFIAKLFKLIPGNFP